MDGRDAGELAIVIFCGVLFVGYHLWLYLLRKLLRGRAGLRSSKYFNVYETAGLTRLLWTHAMISDEKEAITGVQTLRNAIMVCALLATASAYVGGRALPAILFDPSWRESLDSIAVRLIIETYEHLRQVFIREPIVDYHYLRRNLPESCTQH